MLGIPGLLHFKANPLQLSPGNNDLSLRRRWSHFSAVGFHIPSKAEQAQDHDSIPVGVEFVPGHTMAGGLGKSVVVVVPSLSKSK
jgi:hypothetical protein